MSSKLLLVAMYNLRIKEVKDVTELLEFECKSTYTNALGHEVPVPDQMKYYTKKFKMWVLDYIKGRSKVKHPKLEDDHRPADVPHHLYRAYKVYRSLTGFGHLSL